MSPRIYWISDENDEMIIDDEDDDDDVDESYIYDDVSSNATTIFL